VEWGVKVRRIVGDVGEVDTLGEEVDGIVVGQAAVEAERVKAVDGVTLVVPPAGFDLLDGADR